MTNKKSNTSQSTPSGPCHEYILDRYKSSRLPATALHKECDDPAALGLRCPVSGCRAPQLAAGEVQERLDKGFTSALSKLTRRWRPLLTADEWGQLLSDFKSGKSHIAYILILKLSVWQQLPWYLCILGHLDEEIARDGAVKIIAMWEAMPNVEANHRLTIMVCHPATELGCQLRAFSRGAARRSLLAFNKLCCSLLLVQVTERSVEAAHKDVHMSCNYRNSGPVAVAQALREPEMSKVVATDDGHAKLVEIIEEVKSAVMLAHRCGVQGHPWWQALPGRAGTHLRFSVLKNIVYRCDPISQFLCDSHLSQYEQYHSKQQTKRKREGLIAVGQDKPKHKLTILSLLASLATEHFRQTVSADSIISLPINDCTTGKATFLQGSKLLSRLNTPAKPQSAASINGFELDIDDANNLDGSIMPELQPNTAEDFQ